jgi:double zinc ribbon protein
VEKIQKPIKFWLWKSPKPVKDAADYSEVELAEFKLQFEVIAKRKEKFNRIITPLALIIFPVTMGFVIAVHIWFLLFIPVFIASSFLFFPVYYCPACRLIHSSSDGHFCPECSGTMRSSVWSSARCSKCGKSPRTYKGGSRNYKIHYCSHCGVKLSDAGV